MCGFGPHRDTCDGTQRLPVSRMGVALAGRSACTLRVRWTVHSGCANTVAYQSRRPGDRHLSMHIVEPDLAAVELSGLPPPAHDIDGAVAGQGVLDVLVHQRPPVEMINM